MACWLVPMEATNKPKRCTQITQSDLLLGVVDGETHAGHLLGMANKIIAKN